MSLDGNGDFVTFVGTNIPIGNDPFTIQAWINPTSIPAGGSNGGQITFWGTQGPTSTANGFRLRGDSAVRHYFWGNDHDESLGGSILADTTGPNGDGWHHLGVTYDGTETNWYFNGSLIGTRAVSGVNVADANYRIGSRLGAEFFDGYLDEISIWDRALSASEIAGGFGLKLRGDETNLVALFDFEDGFVDVAGGDNIPSPQGDATILAAVNAPVPEPSRALLVVFGLAGALLLRRRS